MPPRSESAALRVAFAALGSSDSVGLGGLPHADSLDEAPADLGDPAPHFLDRDDSVASSMDLSVDVGLQKFGDPLRALAAYGRRLLRAHAEAERMKDITNEDDAETRQRSHDKAQQLETFLGDLEKRAKSGDAPGDRAQDEATYFGFPADFLFCNTGLAFEKDNARKRSEDDSEETCSAYVK